MEKFMVVIVHKYHIYPFYSNKIYACNIHNSMSSLRFFSNLKTKYNLVSLEQQQQQKLISPRWIVKIQNTGENMELRMVAIKTGQNLNRFILLFTSTWERPWYICILMTVWLFIWTAGSKTRIILPFSWSFIQESYNDFYLWCPEHFRVGNIVAGRIFQPTSLTPK